MSHTIQRCTMVAGLAVALIGPAHAQIPSNIDYPVFGSTGGVSLMVEYARGLNNESGKDNYIGGRFVIPFAKASVFAGGGYMACSGCGLSSRGGGGAGLAVHLIDGPDQSISLSAQTGFGVTKISGQAVWGIPVGVAIAPRTGNTVRPWVMPMFLLQNNGNETKPGFAAAAGADIALGSAFGIHVGFEVTAISGATPIAAGVGVHYQLP